MIEKIPHPVETAINWAAVGTGFGAFFDFIPKFAALLSAIWLIIQIYVFFERRLKQRKNKDRKDGHI